jgi:hypothetical protein
LQQLRYIISECTTNWEEWLNCSNEAGEL